MHFQAAHGVDSHGQVGPLHTLRYADGDFTEVFDHSTRWQLLVPASDSFSSTNGGADHKESLVGMGGSARPVAKQLQSERDRKCATQAEGAGVLPRCETEDANRTRERKLSARMREAVLDLTDDSDDDFQTEIQKLRKSQLGGGRRGKKRARKMEGLSPSPNKEQRRTALAFAGSMVPHDFLKDTSDPLFVGCNVEVKLGPRDEWVRARFAARAEGDSDSVLVVTPVGEDVIGTFSFYPWEKDKNMGWIMGHGRDIRIPMGAEVWQGVGPGRHVRVAFDDGMNYLGVIAYATACKNWHVFFEDDEEIKIKVPAEDAIPVPIDCSEWLTALGAPWWGHRYASRLRNGAEAARRSLREMKNIIEDRLDRSSTMAFRARLPSKDALEKERERERARREAQRNKHLESACGRDIKRSRIFINMHRDVRVKLTDLRERQDKSTVRWDQLCDVIEASGGLTEVDSNQKWGQVLKELRVDASKIDQNSASVFRTWYLEKKRSRPESQKRWVARKTMVTEEAEVEQHLNSGTSASAAKARMAGHDVTSQVEVETVLRPRKLTERVYQQHLRNLKELFSNSMLPGAAGAPKWRACAWAGKPCPSACDCKWTGFASAVGTMGPVLTEPKQLNSGSVFASRSQSPAIQASVIQPVLGPSAGGVTKDGALLDPTSTEEPADCAAGTSRTEERSDTPRAGFVCLSSVAGKSSANQKPEVIVETSLQQVLDDSRNVREDALSVGLCEARDSQLEASASILTKWWRRIRSFSAANTSSSKTASRGSVPLEGAEQATLLSAADVKTLEQCPHCKKSFFDWAYQQRAALMTTHLQRCCAHLMCPSLRSSTKMLVEENEHEPAADDRFDDPFAAYRCCGRTYLRTKDLERHWERCHERGVVACARGYADPSNLLRMKNNQVNLL